MNLISMLLDSGSWNELGAVKAIDETNARLELKVDSRCSIYSRSLMKWCDGQIVDQIVDEETDEEWLVVQYGTKKKRMQRFNPSLRTLQNKSNDIGWDESLAIAITQKLKETKIPLIKLSLPDTPFDAPSVSICDITDRSASIELSLNGFKSLLSDPDSDSNRIYIQFRIMYYYEYNGKRTKTGLVESELLMNDHWERTITFPLKSKLSNAEYAIRGSYRFAGTSVWSQLSDPKSLMLYSSTHYNAMLVFAYWMRTIFHSMSVSHEMLVDIMWRYYFTLDFKWNPDSNRQNVQLSDDGKRITVEVSSGAGWEWRSVHSKNVLSSAAGAKCRWEVTLKQISSANFDKLCIGYFDSESIRQFNPNQILGRGKDEVAFYVGGGEYPAVFTNRCHRNLDENWSLTTRIGDGFTLIFDFAERQCSAFHNDKFCGIISTELPDSIYLAASIRKGRWDEIELETTCFDTHC